MPKIVCLILSSAALGVNAWKRIIAELIDQTAPESVVAINDGYLVSRLGNQQMPGGIFKYDKFGNKVSDDVFDHVHQEDSGVRGLEVTAQNDMVFAAIDGAVKIYNLSSDGLSAFRSVNVSGYFPNGVCLDKTESNLYVTDPGYALGQNGAVKAGAGGFWKIDLTNFDLTQIDWDNGTIFSPNGCVVHQDGKVYMATFVHGVHSYDIEGGGIWDQTVDWSVQLLRTQESERVVGDGIAFWNERFYVSMWNMANGAIWECDPSKSTEYCESVADVAAADINLDGNMLLAPDLIGSKVREVSLQQAETSLATKAGLHYLLITSLLALFGAKFI